MAALHSLLAMRLPTTPTMGPPRAQCQSAPTHRTVHSCLSPTRQHPLGLIAAPSQEGERPEVALVREEESEDESEDSGEDDDDESESEESEDEGEEDDGDGAASSAAGGKKGKAVELD